MEYAVVADRPVPVPRWLSGNDCLEVVVGVISIGNQGRTFIRAWRLDDWFFRVCGWGLSVEPLTDHRPLFSERLGKQQAWHRFGHCIKPLRRREVVP